jgi:hypothetical protein
MALRIAVHPSTLVKRFVLFLVFSVVAWGVYAQVAKRNSGLGHRLAEALIIEAGQFKLEGVAWDSGKSCPSGPPMIFTRQ